MKTLLLTASVLAITVAGPAHAEMNKANNEDTPQTQQYSAEEAERNVEQAYEDSKKAVSDAANDTADATENLYNDIKARLVGSDDVETRKYLKVSMNDTAEGMLGQPIMNIQGERVGTVTDMILTPTGEVNSIIVSDGGFLSLGVKKAAFDYDVIISQNEEGAFTSRLSEADIDNAVEYNAKAETGWSLSKLLDSDVEDPRGDDVANVENITFSGGEAHHVILAANEVLGLGGDKAAMGFDNLEIVRDEDEYDIMLSAEQSADLKAIIQMKSAKTSIVQ